ncbi:MAG: AMP-binding protein [Alphaproteobacteria bacterium]|nr:AMP-binding protein [Alphaproteobacteria bacterium]
MLIADILRIGAQRAPSHIAIVDGARKLAYDALDARTDRLAAALVAAGLGKGERIAAMMVNRAEYAELFFAAARAGSVLAHVSTRATANDLAYMLGKIGARALFIQRDLLATFEGARALGAQVERVVVVDGPGADLAAFAAIDAPHAFPALTPDDLLAINFTGGTTGRPKAVVVTHGARATSAQCGRELFGLDASDVCAVATPMFHTVGLYVWFGTVMLVGATAVMMRGWDAQRFIDLAETHAITAGMFVPTQLNDVLRAPTFLPARLRSLRKVHFAGAPMAVALLDRLEAQLPWTSFVEHYGQSETGPVTLRAAGYNAIKRESIGRPVPGIEVRIVDQATGAPCPPGVVGELVTRGPHLLSGYWDDPEQTAHAFRYGDGWLATGDLGICDGDGFIRLVDRLKDMIISGGENIYPIEIENALYRHPAVAECAVFGVPDDHWGEVPVAHVVLRPGARATAEEIIDHVERETARWKRPRVVEFVRELPKTAVGKIQKNVIRDPYWRSRPRRI